MCVCVRVFCRKRCRVDLHRTSKQNTTPVTLNTCQPFSCNTCDLQRGISGWKSVSPLFAILKSSSAFLTQLSFWQRVIVSQNNSISAKKNWFRIRNLQQNKEKRKQHRFSRVKCHADVARGHHTCQLKVPIVSAHAQRK